MPSRSMKGMRMPERGHQHVTLAENASGGGAVILGLVAGAIAFLVLLYVFAGQLFPGDGKPVAPDAPPAQAQAPAK